MQCSIGNWVIGCWLNTTVLTKWGTRLVFATICIWFWLWASTGLCDLCDWSRLVCACVCTLVVTYWLHYQLPSQCCLYHTSYTELGERMALSDVVIAYFKAPYKLLIKKQLYIYIPLYISLMRLRWSRGSVLAFSTQVRGFKPSRSLRIFKGEKILSTPSFGGEVKPLVPCRRFAACKRSLNGVEVVILAKLPDDIPAHSSHFRRWDLSRRGGRGGTWWWKVGTSKKRGKAMASYPSELAQDAAYQSHTSRLTELWSLPRPAQGLNTNKKKIWNS